LRSGAELEIVLIIKGVFWMRTEAEEIERLVKEYD